MRRGHHLSCETALLSRGLLVLLIGSVSCAAPSSNDSSSSESAGAIGDEGLYARIVSVMTSGNLCPEGSPTVQMTALGDVVDLGIGGQVVCEPPKGSDGAGTSEPTRASSGSGQSADPSCSVTLELELPAGVRIGVPRARWIGDVSNEESATRSYSFENGESSSTPPTTLRSQRNFSLQDGSLPAFSSCSGPQRVHMTATFQASLACPDGKVALDSAEFSTSWGEGTEFKECSPGASTIEPGLAGEWCAGYPQRACASGLKCQFSERMLPVDGSGSAAGEQGTCVDPAQPPAVADLDEACGGLQNIQCVPEAICWHKPAAPAGWLGRCEPAISQAGDRCHLGSPLLECALPFVCHEPVHKCVDAHGQEGDPCGEPYLPECLAPLYCNEEEAMRGNDGTPIRIAYCAARRP